MLVSRLVYVRWALYSLHGWLDQTLEVGVPLHKLEVETVPLHHIPRHLHPKNMEQGMKGEREGEGSREEAVERRTVCRPYCALEIFEAFDPRMHACMHTHTQPHTARHLHVSPLYVVVDVEGLCEGHVEKLHVIRSTDLRVCIGIGRGGRGVERGRRREVGRRRGWEEREGEGRGRRKGKV